MKILDDLKTTCEGLEAEAKQEAEQLLAKVKGAVLTRIAIAAAAGLTVGVLVGHFAW